MTGNLKWKLQLRIEEYNIIECIVESELFEITRKMQLIKALLTKGDKRNS